MHKWFIAILIMALLPCSLHGQETELKSTKAKAAVRDYERKIEDVDEDFEKQLKNLEKSYQMKSQILRARLLSNLNAAMEEEAKRVRLEEATEIKELIKQRKETELPTLDQLKWKVAKAKIPKTAVKFNGHHYAICTEQKTWHMARDYSESLGGHLARIESREELEFVIALKKNVKATGFFWIDGSDETTENDWRFSDGRQMSFTAWKPGEPNDGFNGEHHLVLDDSMLFRDGQARSRFHFIIEWDK
jgi:hypothetical protein